MGDCLHLHETKPVGAMSCWEDCRSKPCNLQYSSGDSCCLDAFIAPGTPAHLIFGASEWSQVPGFALPERQFAFDDLFDQEIDGSDSNGYAFM